MISYGRQSISSADIEAVAAVLSGNWLTQGPAIEAFEECVAEYVGAKHAVAYSSGTSALHGAAFAAGLGKGDHVYTSPLTFMASANCARYVGATPRLVDIDDVSLNMKVGDVPSDARGVIVVHYAGLPVDLSGFDRNGRVVIEDAAHALGSMTPYGPVGNCAHSDMCCFSFHPVKPVTTAEGGIVTTNDDSLAEKLRTFRTHGIRRDPSVAPWYYEISDLGYNYRMTDIQAALGLSQMSRIEEFILRRNDIADRYHRELDTSKFRLPARAPEGWRHGYHLFVVRSSARRRLYDHLQSAGIMSQVHYVPVHQHPISRDIELVQPLTNCDAAYEQILSIPIYPDLSDYDQTLVIKTLNSFE